MKIKTTKKAVKNHFSKVIALGYCDMQRLLSYFRAFGYSSGVYGWSCDYYEFGDVCISTGYSPIGTRADWQLIKEMESRMEAYCLDHGFNGTCCDEAERLMAEFIKRTK